MIGVERVAGAAVIGVARAIFLKDVVGAVVQTTETQRRPGVVAFGGVVEDHVENDLDARPMQRLDHVAELVNGTQRILARAVALVRRKERDRRVSPVVDEPGRSILDIVLKYRHELDGADTELLQIRDLLDEAGIRASCSLREPGARIAGEPSHVQLVNDRPGGRPLQRRVALPIVGLWIDHHALHGGRGVVALPARSLAAVIFGDDHAAPIRIEEHLRGVEPQSARWIVRTLDAVGVELPRLHTRDEHVPIVVGAVGRRVDRNHARRTRIVLTVEEQQLDARGTAREHTEVHAVV